MRRMTGLAAIAVVILAATLTTCTGPSTGTGGRATTQGTAQRQLRPGAQVTNAQVEAAMKKAAEYLLKQPSWEAGKGWDKPAAETGGQTALVALALLQAQQGTRDERLLPRSKEMLPRLTWLLEQKPDATYVAALQAEVAAQLPSIKPFDRKKIAQQDAEVLHAGMQPQGGHTYSVAEAKAHPGQWDTSNSDYAVVGADAAERIGVEVPTAFWQTYDRFWRTAQNKDGGWGYAPQTRPESAAATSAGGLAALLTVRQHLKGAKNDDAVVRNALAKMNKDFNPASQDYYYLYNVERVALALGLSEINHRDWYKEIAANLVRTQKDDGSWEGGQLTFWGKSTPVATTAYALLILARGNVTVGFNKLEHKADWNTHEQDVAHLAYRTGRMLCEGPLEWQSVSFDTPEEIWRRAPVLVITGSRDPGFGPDEIARLRAYVAHGGLIFSSSDGGSPEFTRAMTRYAQEVGQQRYEMRELPQDHAILQGWMKVRNPGKLIGLSNGVRELWIHSKADVGADLQERRLAARESFDLPANAYYYAAGRRTLASRLGRDAMGGRGM